jgi:DNA-binding transcriptional MocR family regulator
MATRRTPEAGHPPPAAHDQPLYRQLYLRLRESILSGALKPGQRLASSRALASQTGLARNTVLHAFQQLEVDYCIMPVRRDVPRLLAHYRAGDLKLDELISRRIDLEDVNEAFSAMEAGEVARSVINYGIE